MLTFGQCKRKTQFRTWSGISWIRAQNNFAKPTQKFRKHEYSNNQNQKSIFWSLESIFQMSYWACRRVNSSPSFRTWSGIPWIRVQNNFTKPTQKLKNSKTQKPEYPNTIILKTFLHPTTYFLKPKPSPEPVEVELHHQYWRRLRRQIRKITKTKVYLPRIVHSVN